MKIRCMNCMREYEDGLECCPKCGFVRGTQPKEIYQLHTEVVLADRYVIGTVVDCGGFGILYRAWDRELQVMVAVKEYFPPSYVNRNPGEKDVFIYTSKKQREFQEGLVGFLDEARNTAKFSSHPNIVNVYNYFEENKTAYMVMEYMEGITMKEYLKGQGGRMKWAEAVEIIARLCDALKAVHEAGILHRDISPDNIMLCKGGAVKLFDFGAARFSSTEHEMLRPVILKIGYAPPEQYQSKSLQGPWTDIYALGATLYRAVTGIIPDESVNRQAEIFEEGKDTLIRPKALLEDIPGYLDIAICRAMAIQPELRFKNVQQLKDAILNNKQYRDLQKELESRRKKRTLGIGLLIVVLTAVIAGCFAYYRQKRNETTLSGARVSIWLPVADRGSAQEAETMIEAMLEEFYADYPEVQVDISCFQEDEYRQRLQEADQTDGFPTLYESGGLRGGFEGHMDDISDVLKLIQPSDCYCLEMSLEEDKTLKQLPLGMHIAVVYGNTTLLEENTSPDRKNDRNGFLEGRSPLWIADSRVYGEVQAELPGIYFVMPLEQERLIAGFDQLWSVDSGARALDKAAAKRILYYFLGESAQDVRHLQNDGYLPLNKNEFAAYIEVNQELEFLKDQLESGLPAEFFSEEEYYKELDVCYENLISDQEALKSIRERQEEGGT